MGLSSSKQKSSSKSTATSTPNVPSWITAPYKDFASQVGTLAANPTGGVQVGPSGLQSTAFANAGGLGGVNQAVQDALGGTRGLMGYTPSNVAAGQVRDADLSAYMNPYEDAVVSRSISDLDRARAGTISANQGTATMAGAFGGSRHGVADAETNRGFLDTAATLAANLRSAGFNNAQTMAASDIDRRLTADSLNASLGLQGANLRLGASNQLGTMGLAEDASRRADIGLQGDLGAQQREIDVQSNPQEARLKELARISALLSMLQGYPVGQTTNSTSSGTTSSSPSGISMIGTGLSALGSLFSDRRLKRDAAVLGEGSSRWWTYRYAWDAPGMVRIGVMADEAPAHAVRQHASGYLMVDYGAL